MPANTPRTAGRPSAAMADEAPALARTTPRAGPRGDASPPRKRPARARRAQEPHPAPDSGPRQPTPSAGAASGSTPAPADPSAEPAPGRLTRALKRIRTSTPALVSSIEDMRGVLINLLMIGAVLGAVPIVYKAVTRDALVIGEIGAADALDRRGLTGAVLASRLNDEILAVSRFTSQEIERSEISPVKLEDTLPEIELPVEGLNLAKAVSQLRSFLGYQSRTISGEVVIEQERDDKTGRGALYTLRLREGGEGVVYRNLQPEENIDKLMREAAVRILQRYDPMVVAFYHLIRKDFRAAEIAADLANASGKASAKIAVLHLKGLVARNRNDWQGAAEYFRQVIALKSDFRGAHSQLASVLRRYDRAEAEVVARRMTETFPDYAPGYVNLALLELVKRNPPGSLAFIAKAEEVAPADPEVHFQKMFVLRTLGRYEDALTSLARAQALAPEGVNPLHQAAIIQRDMGRLADALGSAETLVAIEPQNPVGYVEQARTLTLMKRLDRAEEMARKALALDPASGGALANLANIHVQAGRLDEARTLFEDALRQAPRQQELHEFRGDLLAAQGDGAGAIESYRLAIEYGTYPAWLMSHPSAKAGRLLEARGALPQAIENYERAIRLDPRAYGGLRATVAALRARLPARPPAGGAAAAPPTERPQPTQPDQPAATASQGRD